MENTKTKTKTKFRGRFKFSLCKWLRINNKIYTDNDNQNEKDWDNDEQNEKDWDNDGLINGNKPIIVKHRPPVFYIKS